MLKPPNSQNTVNYSSFPSIHAKLLAAYILYISQGKYDQAAEMYRDGGAIQRAVAMFHELCMFDKAASWSGMHTSDINNAAIAPADTVTDTATDTVTAAVDHHIEVRYPYSHRDQPFANVSLCCACVITHRAYQAYVNFQPPA